MFVNKHFANFADINWEFLWLKIWNFQGIIFTWTRAYREIQICISVPLKSTQGKKEEEESLSRGLTPSFCVIFHVICFLSTNEDFTKKNWLRQFRNFSRKLLWWTFFQLSCIPTVFRLQLCFIKRTRQIFFLGICTEN